MVGPATNDEDARPAVLDPPAPEETRDGMASADTVPAGAGAAVPALVLASAAAAPAGKNQRAITAFFAGKAARSAPVEPEPVQDMANAEMDELETARDAGPVEPEGPSEPPARPKKPRKKKAPATSQDEEAEQGAEEPAAPKKPRRKSKTGKATGTDGEEGGQPSAEVEANQPTSSKGKKQAPIPGQPNIRSFFGVPKGEVPPVAATVSAPEPIVPPEEQEAQVAPPSPVPAAAQAAPVPAEHVESSLEEEVELEQPASVPDPIEDSDAPAQDTPRRSPRKLRKRKSTEAQPVAPLEDVAEPAKKKSTKSGGRKKKGVKPVASGSAATETGGVISLDSESETDNKPTGSAASETSDGAPTAPGVRDIMLLGDFFLTPAERARKKQLLAQKKAREEVERHSKEAAIFAQKQIGDAGAGSGDGSGHWFFEKRNTGRVGDESGGSEALLPLKEEVEACFPSAENMHFVGSVGEQPPLTNTFGNFTLRTSPAQPEFSSPLLPKENSEMWTALFSSKSPSSSSLPSASHSVPEVRRLPLESVLDQVHRDFDQETLKHPACMRLYEMLATGNRIEDRDGTELWVDKYRPRDGSQVLGNEEVVSELTRWMEKRKVDVENIQQQSARPSKKGKESGRKAKRGKKRSRRDLDDFIVDSDESDSDFSFDEDVSNTSASTILLVGPCGSGKTAMVGAVATQLGYSMIEINEGQKRDSKSVLNEIGEATVNHTLMASSMSSAPPREEAVTQDKPKKSGIASMFVARQEKVEAAAKQAEAEAQIAGEEEEDDDEEEEHPLVKRKRTQKRNVLFSDSDEEQVDAPAVIASDIPSALSETGDMNGASSPHGEKRKRMIRLRLPDDAPPSSLVSTETSAKQPSAGQTVIVFDNVDIVYEEDKGFWSAIASMAERTKRPLVLTASSAVVVEQLPPTLAEDTVVKHTVKPVSDLLAAYVHLVCLLEGVWVDRSQIVGLVERCGTEVGKALRAAELATVVSRNRLPGQGPTSDGHLDLVVCDVSGELVDLEEFRAELGQPGQGMKPAETDGVLGTLARAAASTLGPPLPNMETFVIAADSQEGIATVEEAPSEAPLDSMEVAPVSQVADEENKGEESATPELELPLVETQIVPGTQLDPLPTEVNPATPEIEMAEAEPANNTAPQPLKIFSDVDSLEEDVAPSEHAPQEESAHSVAGADTEATEEDPPAKSVVVLPEPVKIPTFTRPRKQDETDRRHAAVLEAFASRAEALSAWDSEIHAKLALRRFLDDIPETFEGETLSSPPAGALVPAYAIGKPILFDSIGRRQGPLVTYFNEADAAEELDSLSFKTCKDTVEKILGSVERPEVNAKLLWAEVKEERDRAHAKHACHRIDTELLRELMRDDLLRWSHRSVATDAIPLVASILRADKFKLENDVEGESTQGRRRVTRASKQKRRYFLDALEGTQIDAFLESRETLVEGL